MSKNSNFSSKKNLIQSIISAEPMVYGAATSTTPTTTDVVKFAFHDGETVATTGGAGQIVFNTGAGAKNSGIITVGDKLVSSKILSVDASKKGDSLGVNEISVSYVDETDFSVKTSNIEIVDSSAAVMEPGYTTDYMIGGLNKNVNIGGKSVTEVLDMILKPEYAPTFTDATVAISCTAANNGDVKEVGTKTPSESTYGSTGNTAYTTAGNKVAHGGDATVTYAINSATAGDGLTYDTSTSKPGVFKVRVSRVYAVGTEKVQSNKGTDTQKIASNATTLLENASNSDKVDAEYHIKTITKTADLTINYAYKIYASTVTDGVLTSQGLKTTVNGVEAVLKGGSGKQKFALPATYTGVKIEEWNETLKSWTDTTTGWSTSSTTYQVADGTDRTYTVYTRNGVSGEDMKAKISATVGA